MNQQLDVWLGLAREAASLDQEDNGVATHDAAEQGDQFEPEDDARAARCLAPQVVDLVVEEIVLVGASIVSQKGTGLQE